MNETLINDDDEKVKFNCCEDFSCSYCCSTLCWPCLNIYEFWYSIFYSKYSMIIFTVISILIYITYNKVLACSTEKEEANSPNMKHFLTQTLISIHEPKSFFYFIFNVLFFHFLFYSTVPPLKCMIHFEIFTEV
jgi:hypothetical protein